MQEVKVSIPWLQYALKFFLNAVLNSYLTTEWLNLTLAFLWIGLKLSVVLLHQE
jgi:hypothetical protein